MQLQASAGDEAASSEILSVIINLKKQVRFDMFTYAVTPLTCSLLDAAWFMRLPEVVDPEIQIVNIAMQEGQAK